MVAQLSAYPRFRRNDHTLFGGVAPFDYIRWGPLQTPTDLSVVTYDVSCHGPPSWPESSSFVGVWSRGFDCCVSDFVPTTSGGAPVPLCRPCRISRVPVLALLAPSSSAYRKRSALGVGTLPGRRTLRGVNVDPGGLAFGEVEFSGEEEIASPPWPEGSTRLPLTPSPWPFPAVA